MIHPAQPPKCSRVQLWRRGLGDKGKTKAYQSNRWRHYEEPINSAEWTSDAGLPLCTKIRRLKHLLPVYFH